MRADWWNGYILGMGMARGTDAALHGDPAGVLAALVVTLLLFAGRWLLVQIPAIANGGHEASKGLMAEPGGAYGYPTPTERDDQ